MGQGDPDAEKDRAADDRPEDFVAESVHVALHQSHDWRIGDRSIAGCARAHALFARASPAIRSVYNSRIGRRPTLCDRDDPERSLQCRKYLVRSTCALKHISNEPIVSEYHMPLRVFTTIEITG